MGEHKSKPFAMAGMNWKCFGGAKDVEVGVTGGGHAGVYVDSKDAITKKSKDIEVGITGGGRAGVYAKP